MALQINSLTLFIVKIFLCLPLCYWGWFYLADLSSWLLVGLAESLLQSLFPELILGIKQAGYLVEVIVKVTVPEQTIPKGMVAELPIQVNPLIYSYSLPLALALTLASPFKFYRTLGVIFINIFLFLCIQVWGIGFESMKVLFLQTSPDLIGNIRLPSWQIDFIALGYQLGVLILPAVTPIIIWLVFYQEAISLYAPIFKQKFKQK